MGDTIADTFPDANAAQVVADIVASDNINAIITPAMVNNTISLTLNNKNIASIEGIIVFLNLTNLQLNNNQLTALPNDFGNLSSLATLRLDYNQLASLPGGFGSLGNLRWVYLLNNQLTSLPDDFGNLSNLLWLFLFNNQLTSLADSFVDLNNLQAVTFNNNLLLTGFESSLPNISIPPGTTFDQLKLQSEILPVDIREQTGLDNLNLASMVDLQS